MAAPQPLRGPTAAVGVDVNRDGRTDFIVVGPDRNRDGVPDALQPRVRPIDSVGSRHTIDLSRQNPTMLRAWGEYLSGQTGSLETMLREQQTVKSEIVLQERRNRELENELLVLERVLTGNYQIIQAGGRLQPTQLQVPTLGAGIPTRAIDTNLSGKPDTFVVGGNRETAIRAFDTSRVGRADTWVVGGDPETPMAVVAFDTNRDGKADTWLVGADRSRSGKPDALEMLLKVGADRSGGGIPDALQSFSEAVPARPAIVALDTNRDGTADAFVVGADRDRAGIPNAWQGPLAAAVPARTPIAAVAPDTRGERRAHAVVVEEDRIRGSIPGGLPQTLSGAVPVRPPVAAVALDTSRDGAPLALQQPVTVAVPARPPVVAVSLDANPDGRFGYAMAGAINTPQRPPVAAVGIDASGDGKADVIVLGPDSNRNGLPDALECSPSGTTEAAVGLDMNSDGRADLFVSGRDKAASDDAFRLEQAIHIHGMQVHSVAMHPNNSWIATASWDSTVKLFDLDSKSVVRTLGDARDANDVTMAGLYSVAFSKTMPDLLGCTSADTNVYIWNYNTGKTACVLTGHTDEVNGIDFHPTRHVIATAADDSTCIIWDLEEKALLRTLDQHTKPVYGCAFMGRENEFLVATCSFDRSTRIFDMRNREVVARLQTHTDDVTGIDYNSSKQWIATGSDDGRISIVCARQRSLLAQIDTREGLPENEVKRVRFSPCGCMLAAACSSGLVLLYDMTESLAKRRAVLSGHAECVFDVAWGVSSGGAKMLVSASHDRTCGYWKEVI